jgi:cysteine synthase
MPWYLLKLRLSIQVPLRIDGSKMIEDASRWSLTTRRNNSEGTSGNTGMGLALVANKGYN